MRYVFFLLAIYAHAADDKIICIGPAADQAKQFYVYMHGAGDASTQTSAQRTLQRIADQKKVRFALPQAQQTCKGGDYKGQPCWIGGAVDDTSYREGLRLAENAADKCSPGKEHGLIGMSAGGFFTSALIAFCAPNKFTRLIAVGGGVPKSKWDSQNLKGCGPKLEFVVGNNDPYKAAVKGAFETFKSRGADVTYEEYEGGHEFKFEPLEHLFD